MSAFRGSLANLAADGWLPVQCDVLHSRVTFAPLAGASFREPWYDATVRNHAHHDLTTCGTNTLIEQSSTLMVLNPARFIAHTGHSGSTLMANLLALRRETLVLKEPRFLRALLELAPNDCPQQTRNEIIRALIRYCRAVSASWGRNLVLKLASSATGTVMDATGVERGARWLLLWREPEYVVSSRITMPLSAEREKWLRELIGSGWNQQTSSLTSVEFYAHVWRLSVAPFIRQDDIGVLWRHLDYATFVADKRRAVRAAEEWLGVGGGSLPTGFDSEQRRYSKAEDGQLFEPTGVHRRPALGHDDRITVNDITDESIRALEAHTRTRLLDPSDGSC
jgi:hypothetical protein